MKQIQAMIQGKPCRRSVMRAMLELLLVGVLLAGGPRTTLAEASVMAPMFSLPALQGGEAVSLEQFRGKVVYLDFWASWCGPCRQSLPMLDALRAEIGNDRFEVVAINLDEKPEQGLAFLAQFPVRYPVLFDAPKQTPRDYQLQGMPSAFLIDAQGYIRLAHTGFKPADIEPLRAAVLQLIATHPTPGAQHAN